MDINFRHQVIKRVQAGLPRGAPFDLAVLSQFGVSPQLAAHYADSGWLVRLAHGVYAFPNDEFGVYGALRFLSQRVPGLHVGGKSALALQGVRHNLGSREALVLWGDSRFASSYSGRRSGLFTLYRPWICFTRSSESETTFSRAWPDFSA